MTPAQQPRRRERIEAIRRACHEEALRQVERRLRAGQQQGNPYIEREAQ
jgi:hypothetical protein